MKPSPIDSRNLTRGNLAGRGSQRAPDRERQRPSCACSLSRTNEQCGRLSRRQFLGLGLVALPAAAGIDGRFAEPTWLARHPLGSSSAADLPFCALQRSALQRRRRLRDQSRGHDQRACAGVRLLHGRSGGRRRFAPAALDFIRQIERPVYGCPGNWDYRSGADFREYEKAFAATGGAWLEDRSIVLPKHDLELIGMGLRGVTCSAKPRPRAGYSAHPLSDPGRSARWPALRFDPRRPFPRRSGAPAFLRRAVLPYGVGRYQQGRYDSLGGPLYVNVGIGTYMFPVRFNCRPEITVVQV